MFGFLKKLFGGNKDKEAPKRIEKRKGQRRKEHNDRREEIRWEPDKTDRRSGKDRRKNINTWEGHDQ
ncbi:MAG: hypothetical protein R3E90_05880 [Marinicella sp.]|nr:hypothetical protein [Xanthomonadales bacterium]